MSSTVVLTENFKFEYGDILHASGIDILEWTVDHFMLPPWTVTADPLDGFYALVDSGVIAIPAMTADDRDGGYSVAAAARWWFGVLEALFKLHYGSSFCFGYSVSFTGFTITLSRNTTKKLRGTNNARTRTCKVAKQTQNSKLQT